MKNWNMNFINNKRGCFVMAIYHPFPPINTRSNLHHISSVHTFIDITIAIAKPTISKCQIQDKYQRVTSKQISIFPIPWSWFTVLQFICCLVKDQWKFNFNRISKSSLARVNMNNGRECVWNLINHLTETSILKL